MTWPRHGSTALVFALALLGLTAWAATSANAEEDKPPYNFDLKACTTAARTGAAIDDCIQRAYLQEDEALNAAYQRLMRRLAPAERSHLRTVERAWIKARDAECDMVYSDAGLGTLSRTNGISCNFEETRKRRERLEAIEARLGPSAP
ncbi:lysozyme inhibitor LprI family protein [Phenylobacterium sp.]|uniref:lysozyme inhibitor LprI family protein n=1 Tax=Phenylobacterium sp. TaxID=1871053 RepID=UPI0035B2CA0B